MVDSIQSRSTVPLPDFQTGKGSQDPLPVNAPKDVKRTGDAAKLDQAETQADSFEDYLNDTSRMTLQKRLDDRGFDPLADIAANSVYAQPSGKSPI